MLTAASPKSQYLATPAYNSDLKKREKQERKAYAAKGIKVKKESDYTRRW